MLKARLRAHKTVKDAFTLIELMIVVVIVAILATAAIPLYTAAVDEAEWAEGIAGAGAIHSAARVQIAKTGTVAGITDYNDLGVADTDLDGKYFDNGDYAFAASSATEYTITVTNGDGDEYIVDEDGADGGGDYWPF